MRGCRRAFRGLKSRRRGASPKSGTPSCNSTPWASRLPLSRHPRYVRKRAPATSPTRLPFILVNPSPAAITGNSPPPDQGVLTSRQIRAEVKSGIRMLSRRKNNSPRIARPALGFKRQIPPAHPLLQASCVSTEVHLGGGRSNPSAGHLAPLSNIVPRPFAKSRLLCECSQSGKTLRKTFSASSRLGGHDHS